MTIAEVSKADSTGGGASRVAEEIVAGLRAAGYTCHQWSRFSGNACFDGKTRLSLYGGRKSRYFARLHRWARQMGYPEIFPFELLALSRFGWRNYDLFHFHDLSSAISPFTLKWLSKRRPVIWTFHDCSPFTAGCLYPMDCERYKTGCGNCPQLHQWPLGCAFDRTRTLLKIKRGLHATRRIVTVAPSSWMANMAIDSGVVLDRPRVIPNGVDVSVFKPHEDRTAAKAFLGINPCRPVVLLSAYDLSACRKGFAYSSAAVRGIRDLHPFVIAVGNPNANLAKNLDGIDHLCTGFIPDQKMLARWYALADVFVFCSLADNMPLAVLETMSCGVPIVGFKTGGIPEMVEQDVTGFLVNQKDQNGLNEALRRALIKGLVSKWGCESRRKAEMEYSMDRFISAHKSLYEESISLFNERHSQSESV